MKLSELTTQELNAFIKKSELAFKQMIKNKDVLSKGIANISDLEIEALGNVTNLKDAPHELVIKCIRVYIDALCRGELIAKDNEKTAFEFGYLYEYCIQLATNSEWRIFFLESESLSEIALVDRNQKFAMYPQMFIYRLLERQQTDNVLLLTYNMIKENKFELAKSTPDKSLKIILT